MQKIDNPFDWAPLPVGEVMPFEERTSSKRDDRFHVTGPVTIWVAEDEAMTNPVPILAAPKAGMYDVQTRFRGLVYLRVDVQEGAQCQCFVHLPKRAQIKFSDPHKQVWTGLPVIQARDPALERVMLMERQRQVAWEQNLKKASEEAAAKAIQAVRDEEAAKKAAELAAAEEEAAKQAVVQSGEISDE